MSASQNEAPRTGETTTLSLALGTSFRSFTYRPQTSDAGVIDQVFQKNDYNIRRLTRAAELIDYGGRKAEGGKTPLIIDAGANIGASPLYFQFCFQNARVIAIEPDDGNFDLLSLNTRGLPVECIRGAVAAAPGRVHVVDPGLGAWGYRTERCDERAENRGHGDSAVTCVTINQLYETHRQDCFPYIVKIDIEGGEDELFSSNTEWVSATPLIIIELHDWMLPGKSSSRNFLKCISNLNRDFVYLNENIFSIDNTLLSRPTP